MTHSALAVTRRSALLGLTAAVTLGRASLAVAAAPGDKRLVVVILRGALDGMAAVVPYGDPDLATLRAELVPAAPGQPDGLLDLGGFYGLHPSLANLHTMFKAGRTAADPRRRRPHPRAQPFRGAGLPGKRRRPPHDQRLAEPRRCRLCPAPSHGRPEGDALAIGVSVPLLLRGPATVGSWAPHGVLTPPPDLYTQIAALNHADRITGPAIAEGMRERGFTTAVMASDDDPAQPAKNRYAFPALARAAGRIAARARRPTGRRAGDRRLGHPPGAGAAPCRRAEATRCRPGRAEAGPGTRLARHRRAGDDRVRPHRPGERHQGHRPRHRHCGVRAGGAVFGGRVAGQWPGLAPGKLYENRDLAPTTDLRSVAKALLAAHLGVPVSALPAVFPNSETAQPMRGLMRT